MAIIETGISYYSDDVIESYWVKIDRRLITPIHQWCIDSLLSPVIVCDGHIYLTNLDDYVMFTLRWNS